MGAYDMTSLSPLLQGGESGEKAIVPHQPDASKLLEEITPVAGQASMPQDKPPLNAAEVELIRRWIEQGAKVAQHTSQELYSPLFAASLCATASRCFAPFFS